MRFDSDQPAKPSEPHTATAATTLGGMRRGIAGAHSRRMVAPLAKACARFPEMRPCLCTCLGKRRGRVEGEGGSFIVGELERGGLEEMGRKMQLLLSLARGESGKFPRRFVPCHLVWGALTSGLPWLCCVLCYHSFTGSGPGCPSDSPRPAPPTPYMKEKEKENIIPPGCPALTSSRSHSPTVQASSPDQI